MESLLDFKKKIASEGIIDWASDTQIEFFWRFKIKGRREKIWAYLSDTSRFNRALGFSPREQAEKDGKVLVKTTMLGFEQEWMEESWNWLFGKTIVSARTYLKGMGSSVQSVFHIEQDGPGDLHSIYIYFGWKPANRFWGMFLKATAAKVKSLFEGAFAKIERHLAIEHQTELENALKVLPAALPQLALDKIAVMQSQLKAQGLNAQCVDRLCDFVATGDDLELESIRLIPLARKWNLDRDELLRICLHATRSGLLNISWEVICPHCRGSRFSAESLGDIPETSECTVCEIGFTTGEANSIEVIFHVHPAIRKVQELLYCAAEPAKKQHIKIQRTLASGQKLEMPVDLPDGIYRARCVGSDWKCKFEVNSRVTSTHFALNSLKEDEKVGSKFQLGFHNASSATVLFVVEDFWWENHSLKPAHVLSVPDFRDIFSQEHLSSNVKLYLGEQTILFTDIVGSTKFYMSVGDAKAFAEVRSHFQEIFKIVATHHGVVVKTIGDAVMAAFASTTDAIEAAVLIQQTFYEDRRDTSIRLRVSLHCGPVIAVRLNAGIDYFGNTVNQAAKIQACAGASEIALSDEVSKRIGNTRIAVFPIQLRQNNRDTEKPVPVHVVKVVATPAMAVSRFR